MINWKKYDPTKHPNTFNVVAAAIAHHREKFLPLKTIYLLPSWYDKFLFYFEKKLYKKTIDGLKLEFDGVNIEKGMFTQKAPLTFEYWENE
jgi:hypothetical protein